MRRPVRRLRAATLVALLALVAGILPAPGPLAAIAPDAARAAHTPAPTSVTIAGSLQSELGCPGDWDPACAATHLTYDATDDVWQGTWTVPAGSYEYKAALNDGWAESYGQNGGANNIPLTLAASTSVKFYYDHTSHWATDNVNSVIAVAAGSFQSELGCPGDWQPDCLRSWLQDPDDDGAYTFTTTAIPVGSYEAKVALGESWDVNYGQGGVQGGANIPFSVTNTDQKVSFRYVAATHVLTILAGHAHDNNVEWDGLRHDSRDTLYRTPGGAVPAGTPVTLRFRTFHDDVTAVKVRFYSVDLGGQQIVPMTRAAADVSCYDATLATDRCDFWQLTLPASWGADNLWYRFIVTDGSATAYYADNTAALDGGAGAATAQPVDNSYALMLYEPDFAAPAWAKDAVIYQIFPDRFSNGRSNNDARTGDVRYDDPVLRLPWGTLPEGYCRNYADATPATCPWRFDASPPAGSPEKESPRGRDYMGGDLMGVTQQLNYLQALGVTTVYFNPIFDAASNHSYDTQDYTKVDPYFGTQKDWENLVKQAGRRGIRIVLDGVFNHLSSDSPFFDRYGHYAAVGACESATSPFRAWFFFHDVAAGTGTCVSSTGVAKGATYDGWFGFDSIPVINKAKATPGSGPSVWSYFLTGADAIAKRWLRAGAAGWRMDVSGDASFPDGYWQTFREVVKATRPDALTISETWQKDSHPPAPAPGRPLRHDDELPAARCRPRLPGARAVRLQGLRRQRPHHHRVRVPLAPLVDPRGLPGRRLLLAHEPARQPRHRAPPLDAHARPGHGGRQGAQRGERRGRQGPRPPGVAHPVHGARRADRLLRRRDRHDRRRRPRRPAHLPCPQPGAPAGHVAARPLHEAGAAAARPRRPDRRRLPGPPRRRRERRCRVRPEDRCAGGRRGDQPRDNGTDRLDPARRLPPRRGRVHHAARARRRRLDHGHVGGRRAQGHDPRQRRPAAGDPEGRPCADRGAAPAARGRGQRHARRLVEHRAPRGLLRRLGEPRHRRRVRQGQPGAAQRDLVRGDRPSERGGGLRRRHCQRRGREREPVLERAERHPAPLDRLGEPPVASHDRPRHQRRQPDTERLRPGLDRRRYQPAGRHADAAGTAGLRARRERPGRRRLELGRRRVQYRRRQQRRVHGVACCRTPSARSTTSTATPRPAAATGSTRT